MSPSVGAVIALIVLGFFVMFELEAAYRKGQHSVIDYGRHSADDEQCRCGSHTHPGFTCDRCGGVA